MATRTGLRTLYQLVRKMCQVFARWSPLIYQVVPSNKHAYLDALSLACDEFVANVPVPSILGDEDAPPLT
jgi:hypothetical protein